MKFLNIQDVEDEIEEGKKLIKELVDYSSKFEREDVHISKLKIGLKCGGSDAFSGITANPLLGRVSDNLVSLGATSIQTEVPEMFGAETILFERSLTEDVFNNSVDLINDFKSQGKAVIMISSEMPEILGLSDRILVLSQGRVTGEFDIKDASQEAILKCAVETKEAK